MLNYSFKHGKMRIWGAFDWQNRILCGPFPFKCLKSPTHRHTPSSVTFLRFLVGSSVYPTINTSSSSHPGTTTTWLDLRQDSRTGLVQEHDDDSIGGVWVLSIPDNLIYIKCSVWKLLPLTPSSGSINALHLIPQTLEHQCSRPTNIICSICWSTLWDGEGLKRGSCSIGGLSLDGGRVIVPEDVQLAWMSVC